MSKLPYFSSCAGRARAILQKLSIKASIIFLFVCFTFRCFAQPMLPDISGAEYNGVILLSWQSQYDGIRSITVLRSEDSVANFKPVGNVKKLKKGVQTFTDDSPLSGMQYYKLSIRFNSGLTWYSNHTGVHYTGNVSSPPEPRHPAAQTSSQAMENPATQQQGTIPCDTSRSRAPRESVSMSFRADTLHNLTDEKAPALHHTVLNIASDETGEMPFCIIPSRFIYTDTLTGHVRIRLPEDVHNHHYSVKFYDAANHMVLEIPHVYNHDLIMDRRNFQHRGVYKFIIRKDVTEFESGYIQVK